MSNRKLTEAQTAHAINEALTSGRPYKDIAGEFGIHERYLYRLVELSHKKREDRGHKRKLIEDFVRENPDCQWSDSPLINKVSAIYFYTIKKGLKVAHNSKLTPEERDEAARLVIQEGKRPKDVAKQFGCTESNVIGLVKVRSKMNLINKHRGKQTTVSTLPTTTITGHIHNPLEEIQFLETLEGFVDGMIGGDITTDKLKKFRREIGRMILDRESQTPTG
jgi:transposase-like protein